MTKRTVASVQRTAKRIVPSFSHGPLNACEKLRSYKQDHEAHSRFVLMEREAHGRRFARTGRTDLITKRTVASFSWNAKRMGDASRVPDVLIGSRILESQQP